MAIGRQMSAVGKWLRSIRRSRETEVGQKLSLLVKCGERSVDLSVSTGPRLINTSVIRRF